MGQGKGMLKRSRFNMVMFAVLVDALLAGRAGIGPRTKVRERFDYNSAVGESWKTQRLLNMVKIRYGDALVFLDVTSVISPSHWRAWWNWEQDWVQALLGITQR